MRLFFQNFNLLILFSITLNIYQSSFFFVFTGYLFPFLGNINMEWINWIYGIEFFRYFDLY
jgi:hypothetical protein